MENKQYVYVLTEDGSWDYDITNDVEIFSTFEKAFESFKHRVALAKTDMNDWLDKSEQAVEESVDVAKEDALFEIYENGNYTRMHDSILIQRKEVL